MQILVYNVHYIYIHIHTHRYKYGYNIKFSRKKNDQARKILGGEEGQDTGKKTQESEKRMQS